jgi:indole-3-glycerol phosphate synthase
MNIKSIKNELQNILSGKSGYSYDAVIQATTNHLRTRERTSPVAEGKHENKGKETARLIDFAMKNDFLKISESGISNPKTIMELRKAGFDGFLIGENL